MEQAPNALTKGSVVKALVTFTLPFLLANVLQSLYGAVDLFVVGQYCDAQSVAADPGDPDCHQFGDGTDLGRDHPHWEIHRDGAVG